MAYTTTNFKTKEDLKEAVAKGDLVTLYIPGIRPFLCIPNGIEYVEGPHGGRHTWHATVIMANGYVVKVK